jgi:8-oxo-dGTP pyrophosphatase MutT (NUDIX family)
MPEPRPSSHRVASAAAVVFDAQKRILLHKRTDNGKWSLPGGMIEVGETAEQAVVREVREETGYDVRVKRLVGVYSAPEHTSVTYVEGNTVHYVNLLFECEVTGGAPQLNDESSAIEWFPPDDLPHPFVANHFPRLSDALAGKTAAFYR